MMSGDLFGYAPPTRKQARVAAALDHMRRLGAAGVERSAASAERSMPGWVELAVEALRSFARGQVGLFTIEAARTVLQGAPGFLPRPPDGRAWGKVVQVAAQRGYLCKTDKSEPTASSNGSPKPLWKRGPQA